MKKISIFEPNIWALGAMSFFINSSTIIVVTLSPLFLIKVVGLAPAQLGLMDGTVEFFSWASRIGAGLICDKIISRRKILLPAYTLIALSRPIWIFSLRFTPLLLSRIMDRIGNGLGATPRDALLADSVAEEGLGPAFGLRQALGVLGSMVGAGMLAYFLSTRGENYPLYFSAGTLMAVMALLVVLYAVKDTHQLTNVRSRPLPSWQEVFRHLLQMSPYHWIIVALSFVYMLSNYSYSFIVLLAHQKKSSDAVLPLFMIIQNLSCTLSSLAVGFFMNHFSRKWTIALGVVSIILANTFFAFAYDQTFFLMGMVFWGLQLAVSQVVWPTLISHGTTLENRGIVFGIYYLLTGVALLIASLAFGLLIQYQSSNVALFVSAGMGVVCFGLSLVKVKFESKIPPP